MLSFLNQKPLFHKDGAQRKPIEALPKKPQVVSIHARTLNINYHFSQTSAAKVLTKSGTQRQISSAIKFSRSKTVQKYAALLMSPFYRQHFLRILIKITMHTCVNILWQDSLIKILYIKYTSFILYIYTLYILYISLSFIIPPQRS